MLSTVLFVRIAPAFFAEFLIKLFVPLKLSIVLPVKTAPPLPPAKLLMKWLIPMKLTLLSTV